MSFCASYIKNHAVLTFVAYTFLESSLSGHLSKSLQKSLPSSMSKLTWPLACLITPITLSSSYRNRQVISLAETSPLEIHVRSSTHHLDRVLSKLIYNVPAFNISASPSVSSAVTVEVHLIPTVSRKYKKGGDRKGCAAKLL